MKKENINNTLLAVSPLGAGGMIPIQQALHLILSSAKNFGNEEVSIHDAFNRVLAENIYADRDYPPFNRSAMDGYAVIASDFTNANTQLKLIEKLLAGGIASQKVTKGICIKIMTGAPVPEGADAVVRVEDCIEKNNVVTFNVTAVKQKQNIATQAEDAHNGDLIIKKDIVLGATEISVLAVTGKSKVLVYKLPEITIVSTGNEIVSVESPILPHQIRDSNTYSLKSFLKTYSIYSVNTIQVADDKIKLKEVIKNNLNKDILIISGGVSKGDADYVPEVLISLGVREIFHRVKIKPGAPLWFGALPSGGVVFGLPGNPVSVQIAFKVFIEPFIRRCFNMKSIQPMYFPLFNEKLKKTKFTEYFPCKLITKNKVTGIVSTKMNGSGDISATLGTHGIAVHPEKIESIKENDVVEFYFWNDK
jgi:molybdopterin molybdotransferase